MSDGKKHVVIIGGGIRFSRRLLYGKEIKEKTCRLS